MSAIVERLLAELNEIDTHCHPSASKTDDLHDLLKSIYELSVQTGKKCVGVVRHLHLFDIDEDTLWEEIQTRERPLIRYLQKKIKRLSQPKSSILSDVRKIGQAYCDDGDVSIEEVKEYIYSADIDDQGASDDGEKSSLQEAPVDDDVSLDVDTHEENEEKDDVLSDVDKDMDMWLDEEDELEMKRIVKEERRRDGAPLVDSSDSEENDPVEDDLSFVQRALYEDNDTEDESDGDANYRYEDFFGKSHSTKLLTKPKSVHSSSTSAPLAGKEIDLKTHVDKEMRAEQADLAAEIAAREQNLLQKRSWELGGEVKAAQRPENSLLEVTADIERTTKPTPIITQDFTTSVEELIKRRVKDSKFEDASSSSVPAKGANSTKDANNESADLSQEKSRSGLGEIYEEEFLVRSLSAQPGAAREKLEASRSSARSLFHKVSRQLDGLCHFHFTPRPVETELSVSAAPTKPVVATLELEDVTPIAGGGNGVAAVTSRLAPEQVAASKSARQLLSSNELTSADKKRLRRATNASRKRARALDPASSAGKEPLTKDRRVISSSSDASHSNYAKSASFFADLQERTQADIKKSKHVRAVGGQQQQQQQQNQQQRKQAFTFKL